MHHKGKKKRFKKTVTKTCRKENFYDKIHQQGNVQKEKFFCDKQRREVSILLPKVADSKKTQRKVNEKRRNRLVRKKKHTQKKKKTQGWKNIRKTMKKAEKKE